MTETVTVRGEGLTVDLILHRRYGIRGRELIAQTYELNAGLADLGAFLPLGTRVILPDLPIQQTPTVQRVSLFNRTAP